MIDVATRIVPLIDLTCLKESCSEQDILKLCEKACTPFGNVSSVCVFPQFIDLAKKLLKDSTIKIATVCNFPSGDAPLEKTLTEIDKALLKGANEIDLVMPYHEYFLGERGKTIHYIENCRSACPEPYVLKIILETGAFPSQDLVYAAAKDMIYAGANFIKTSTGKITKGADLESVRAILKAIKDTSSSQHDVGVKISGGINEIGQVIPYLELAEALMGRTWISPHTFRIGTSQLLEHFHASS